MTLSTKDGVTYQISRIGSAPSNASRFWWHWWTPSWHDGRGPYISVGLGFIAFYRGY